MEAQDADSLEQAKTAPPLCDGNPEEAADEAFGDGGFTAGDGGAAAAAAVVQMPESCGAEEEEASADADDDRANGKAEGGALFAEREEASGEGRAEGDASDGTAGLLTVEVRKDEPHGDTFLFVWGLVARCRGGVGFGHEMIALGLGKPLQRTFVV